MDKLEMTFFRLPRVSGRKVRGSWALEVRPQGGGLLQAIQQGLDLISKLQPGERPRVTTITVQEAQP